MARRYGEDPLADSSARDSEYTDPMTELARGYPGDEDAQVLAAETLMMLSPWDYWQGDGSPYPHSVRGRNVIAINRLPVLVVSCRNSCQWATMFSLLTTGRRQGKSA